MIHLLCFCLLSITVHHFLYSSVLKTMVSYILSLLVISDERVNLIPDIPHWSKAIYIYTHTHTHIYIYIVLIIFLSVSPRLTSFWNLRARNIADYFSSVWPKHVKYLFFLHMTFIQTKITLRLVIAILLYWLSFMFLCQQGWSYSGHMFNSYQPSAIIECL